MKVKQYRKILLLVLMICAAILFGCVERALGRQLSTQQIASEWSAEDSYAQISCFFSKDAAVTKDYVIQLEQKLKTADKEVDAFIKSLPREQQAYASNPQFRAQCQEQLEALYSFAKYGEDLKLDETEEYKSVMENARKDILARLAMKQLFDSVKVTDEEVKDYYEANKSQFKKGATVHAKHILTDSEEKCNQILESIVSGEKVFEDAAKEFSTCPSGQSVQISAATVYTAL